jgi:hypothetical protein
LPAGSRLAGTRCQAEAGGLTLCRPDLPSLGTTALELEAGAAEAPHSINLPAVIDTKHYQARIDPGSGALTSLKVKPSGREILTGPILLVAESAGDYHSTPRRPQRRRLADVGKGKPRLTVTEGPLAITVKAEGKLLGGAVGQTIRFYRDHPRIDFETEVKDIPDKTVVLVEFPLAEPILETRRGIPFGFSHGAWSKPNPQLAGFADGILAAIRWSHYQSARGGVALLDRGLPGRELTGNTPTLLLLNALDIYMGYPCAWLSGRGKQRLSYALMATTATGRTPASPSKPGNSMRPQSFWPVWGRTSRAPS